MFKTEIKINDVHYKKIAFAKSFKLKEIITRKLIGEHKIVAVTVNHEYVNIDEVISEKSQINCITYFSHEGRLIYQDTAIFIMMKAFYRLYPTKRFIIEHSIADGVYGEFTNGDTLSQQNTDELIQEMAAVVGEKIPIKKMSITPKKAKQIFESAGRKDILKEHQYKDFNVFKCGKYYDYFIRQLSFNTGCITSFSLLLHSPGIIIRFPMEKEMRVDENFVFPKMLFKTHQEHDKWLRILEAHNSYAINQAIEDFKISDFIQVEEALHEKKIMEIAKEISDNKSLKLLMIAGPSASGKTTFAKKLSVHLRVNGTTPRIIEMDNYFLPRNETPKKENGEPDFESINAINLDLLNNNLTDLLAGKEVKVPKFDFVTGTTSINDNVMKLGKNDVLLLEGIHGLNDTLTSAIPFSQKAKIYVSELNNLNIDWHNRIPTTDVRKIRRMIRDFNFRGHSVDRTLEMWESVREGEKQNIFRFQENADFMFNSTLTYELSVIKKHVLPLLKQVNKYSPNYLEAKRLIKIFSHFYNIPDELVPTNSILREFIGGSVFKY